MGEDNLDEDPVLLENEIDLQKHQIKLQKQEIFLLKKELRLLKKDMQLNKKEPTTKEEPEIVEGKKRGIPPIEERVSKKK